MGMNYSRDEILQMNQDYQFFTWTPQKGSLERMVITGGKGCYFWDTEGNKYLDAGSQLLVTTDAVDVLGAVAGLVQGRQQHSRKDRDDRYHDQELDQSENSCFHSGRKNRRTGNGKTIEQWNIRTFERRNKAGAV